MTNKINPLNSNHSKKTEKDSPSCLKKSTKESSPNFAANIKFKQLMESYGFLMILGGTGGWKLIQLLKFALVLQEKFGEEP